jgi:hypothetical protein
MGKVLHASKSGYFPFCLPEFQDDVTQFTTASVAVVMKSFWVLRSFSITGTYNGPNSVLDFSIVLSNTASKEEEIVCNPTWEVSSSSSLVDIVGSWYDGGGGFYKYGNSIIPNYRISALYEQGQGGGFVIISQTSSGYEETFSFEGMTFYGESGGALSFLITPISYWSYDGTYDTATGNAL